MAASVGITRGMLVIAPVTVLAAVLLLWRGQSAKVKGDAAIAIMIALVIVVGMNLVGALLLSALVVFPALSAMRVCRTFRAVTVLAAVIGSACAVVGMLVSMLFNTPIGSTIVMLDALAFALFCLLGHIRSRRSVAKPQITAIATAFFCRDNPIGLRR